MIFTIPLTDEGQFVEQMNKFLRSNKIIDVKRELGMVEGNSCWTFCVTYMPTTVGIESQSKKNNKVDYRELLSAEVFERFSELRKIRKRLADNDSVPAYAVFTDAELSEIAKLTQLTSSEMLKISGIGKNKLEKYGEALIAIFNQTQYEKSGVSEGENSFFE